MIPRRQYFRYKPRQVSLQSKSLHRKPVYDNIARANALRWGMADGKYPIVRYQSFKSMLRGEPAFF